jgi:hypothetical protein
MGEEGKEGLGNHCTGPVCEVKGHEDRKRPKYAM